MIRSLHGEKDQAEIHLSRKPDHHASTVNVMHMFVSNAAALYSICEAEGVRIIKRPMDKEYGQRAFVFSDPDGNRIDIGERILGYRWLCRSELGCRPSENMMTMSVTVDAGSARSGVRVRTR